MKKTIIRLGYSCTKQSAEAVVPQEQWADKKAKKKISFAHVFSLSLGFICLAFASLAYPHM